MVDNFNSHPDVATEPSLELNPFFSPCRGMCALQKEHENRGWV